MRYIVIVIVCLLITVSMVMNANGTVNGRIDNIDWPASNIHEGVRAPKVSIENQGNERATFWVQYSIQDPTGKWYYGRNSPVTIESRRKSLVNPGSVTINSDMPRGLYKEWVVLSIDYNGHGELDLQFNKFEVS